MAFVDLKWVWNFEILKAIAWYCGWFTVKTKHLVSEEIRCFVFIQGPV